MNTCIWLSKIEDVHHHLCDAGAARVAEIEACYVHCGLEYSCGLIPVTAVKPFVELFNERLGNWCKALPRLSKGSAALRKSLVTKKGEWWFKKVPYKSCRPKLLPKRVAKYPPVFWHGTVFNVLPSFASAQSAKQKKSSQHARLLWSAIKETQSLQIQMLHLIHWTCPGHHEIRGEVPAEVHFAVPLRLKCLTLPVTCSPHRSYRM